MRPPLDSPSGTVELDAGTLALRSFAEGFTVGIQVFEQELRRTGKKGDVRVELLIRTTKRRIERGLQQLMTALELPLIVEIISQQGFSQLSSTEKTEYEHRYNELVSKRLRDLWTIEKKRELIRSLVAKGLTVCENCGRLSETAPYCSERCCLLNYKRENYLRHEHRATSSADVGTTR